MLKRIFTIVFLIFFLIVPLLNKTHAQNITSDNQQKKVDVIVFLREGCTHCEDEEKFLNSLNNERDDILITKYHLENQKDRDVWAEFTSRVRTSKVTPITVIGNRYIIGFSSEKITGKEIIELIDDARKNGISTDIENNALKEAGQGSSICADDGAILCTQDAKPSYYVTLPLIGIIDAQKYPLFGLSALLGFFDGFNPCAMWVLVTFLVILMQLGSRRKMFIFAGIFILAEAIMYSLILTVWYKTWDFVHLDTIITPIVGGVSIIGGLFFLKEWQKKELECKVTNISQRAKTRQKIQQLAMSKFTFLTFLGILGIAFSVNIIEFACSIGIPQAFTKILEINQLSIPTTGLLIAVYILFYMIDDFIVFAIALYGIDKLSLTTRYSKISNLVGGLVMILLGLILIFRSQILLF